jgi:hypothetical protein
VVVVVVVVVVVMEDNPCTDPESSRGLKLPDFPTISTESNKVVNPTHRPPLPVLISFRD